MSRYIHDKVNHELIPVSGYGSRLATSVNNKTLTVHSSFVNIDGYNYGKADITDAVELIAPIESELVASRAYTVGKQFVYRGFLYKVTAPIALDEAIVIGTNCELAPDVTEQMNSMIRIYDLDLGTVTINTNAYYVGGTLPSEYQGAKAYIITAEFNGAYLTGGVNSSSDYVIFLFNNYASQLSFAGIKVICFF